MRLRIPLLFTLLVAGFGNTFAEGVGSLRAASAMSSSSGKPMFVVYGTQTCPYCVALMNRLRTDESLARFANHFVPIKVEQSDPDWQRFNLQYATDRNAVPRIYIIASDGTAIVKQVGAPSGDSLPQMLNSALEKAGPLLAPATARSIEATVKSIAELDANEDWTPTAALLLPIEDDLAIGNPSWEPVAMGSQALQLADTAMMQSLDSARVELTKNTDDFDSLVTWAKVAQLQSMSPSRKRQATALLADLKRWKTDRLRIDQAIVLADAEIMSYQENPRVQKRATDKLILIAKTSQVEQAVAMAEKLLLRIDPSINLIALASTNESPVNKEFRTWTAKSSNATKTAKLRQSNATHVQLETSEGQFVTLRIDQLIEADQAFIREQAKP